MSSPNSHEESQRAALLAEIAELQEELAATQRPRTRASLEADIAELQAQLAALDAGETPPPPTAPLDQSGQSGGTSLGANNTLQGPTYIGDAVARDKLEQWVDSVQAARDAFVAAQQTINIYASEDAPVAPLLRTYLTEDGDIINLSITIPPTNAVASTALSHLRPPIRDFVGRLEEVEVLANMLLSEVAQGSVTAITGVRGMGGVGKSELAFAVAWKLKNDFPDGQIIVELRGAYPFRPPRRKMVSVQAPP
ncbi:MAG: hypothetical protein EI684_12370, partial [Candidatus Viridilinea halotolerans]